MSRNASLILLSLLLFGTGAKGASFPPVRIMPLGDSITMGCCISVEGGYRTPLAALLAHAGYNVDFVGTQTVYSNNPFLPDPDHEGHGGAEIGTLDLGIGDWLSSVEEPDVILLQIGTNDFAGNNDVTNAKTRLENLIARIAALRPHARILVGNLILRTDLPSADQQIQTLFNPYLPEIVARQVALGRHVSLVDLRSVCGLPELADGLHPNLTGYNKIAEAWFDSITQVINPDGTTPQTPIIIGQPSDLSLPLNGTATFSVSASGPGPLTYQWRFNGGPIRGAYAATYTLNNVQLADAGTYTVVVANSWGAVTSSNALLAVVSEGILSNGGFESNYAGWMATGNQSVASAGGLYKATQGSKLAVFNSGNTAPNGVLLQGLNTVIGQTYSLSFDAGVVAFNQSEQRLYVTVQGARPLLARTVSIFGVGNGLAKWLPQSFTFVADSATTTVMFQDISPATAALDLLLDNVRVMAQGPVIRTLAVTSSNPASGVTVRLAPADLNALSAGTSSISRSYAHGTAVTLTAATMAGGNTFAKWQKNGIDYSSNPRTTVTLDANCVMNAVYVPTRVLTVNSSIPTSGLAVRVGPADNNGAGNGVPGFTRLYGDGTSVVLAAPLVAGDRPFKKWQKDGVDFSTSSRISLTLLANVTLTAVY